MLANIWHPLRGVDISELGVRRCLFRFFNWIDLERVLEGSSWIFNNHLLVWKVGETKASLQIPLIRFLENFSMIVALPWTVLAEMGDYVCCGRAKLMFRLEAFIVILLMCMLSFKKRNGG